jgi:hypothetical protein
VEHLAHWCERNAGGAWTAVLNDRLLPHDPARTERIAGWAYTQASRAKATVWLEGKDGLVTLHPRWRNLRGRVTKTLPAPLCRIREPAGPPAIAVLR